MPKIKVLNNYKLCLISKNVDWDTLSSPNKAECKVLDSLRLNKFETHVLTIWAGITENIKIKKAYMKKYYVFVELPKEIKVSRS